MSTPPPLPPHPPYWRGRRKPDALRPGAVEMRGYTVYRNCLHCDTRISRSLHVLPTTQLHSIPNAVSGSGHTRKQKKKKKNRSLSPICEKSTRKMRESASRVVLLVGCSFSLQCDSPNTSSGCFLAFDAHDVCLAGENPASSAPLTVQGREGGSAVIRLRLRMNRVPLPPFPLTVSSVAFMRCFLWTRPKWGIHARCSCHMFLV